MHSREASKCLGQLPKTIQRVNVGGRQPIISHHGLVIQLDLHHSRFCRTHHVLIISVQRNSMPNKINRHGIQTKLLIQLIHGHGIQIPRPPRRRILGIVLLAITQKLGSSPLLKQPHQWRPQGLPIGCRHLFHTTLVQHKRPVNRLELQIFRHIGMNQHLDKVSIRHDKLGNKVNVIVSRGSQFLRRSLPRFKSFKHLVQIQRCRLPSIVRVLIHMKNFVSFDRQQSAENAFFQSSTQDDGIVIFVHGSLCR
mmetsp:Transcript_6009/g.11731  ORF Transcript_6009/g.11731 Transcript_6009/m.11731 type:complete len:252 (+) Transcript_6009:1166-1921(+)